MKRIIFFLIMISFFSGVVYAEKVIMNDRKEYVGNIHHQTDSVIFIVQKEELIKINKADVKEIIEEKKEKKKKKKNKKIKKK